jgi:hypothetical protein
MARTALAILLAITIGGCGSGASPQISDTQYIAIARGAPEAQAFYTKYGRAQESVDRSGRLAVDFRATGARLRIFIEKERVTESFVECPLGSIRPGDVVASIRACP